MRHVGAGFVQGRNTSVGVRMRWVNVVVRLSSGRVIAWLPFRLETCRVQHVSIDMDLPAAILASSVSHVVCDIYCPI